MKVLLAIFSLVIVSFTNPDFSEINEDTVSEKLIFDGYEGEYFFFTNKELKAVVLEAQSEDAAINDLKDNDEVGEEFEVIYSPAKDATHASSEGVIKEIK